MVAKGKKKKTGRKNKKGAGRKLFDGKDEKIVLQKLREAFSLGCTDEEACLFADISCTALYMYQRKNKKFLKQKELLKNNPILIARQSVVRGMESDSDLALKFLERKKKDEFSPKLIVEDTGAEELEELRNDIKSLIKGKNAKNIQTTKKTDKKGA